MCTRPAAEPSLTYESLLRLTLLLTRDKREVVKMVRLMVFNVRSGNKDDHSKNFSFLLDRNNQWRMAPVYDLTPSEGINGGQTCMVNNICLSGKALLCPLEAVVRFIVPPFS